ncbi:MAG: glutamine amidotransferase [Planctomycetota bacterium]|nr:glutamine amidotransferase [Planctomycetota bacterium]
MEIATLQFQGAGGWLLPVVILGVVMTVLAGVGVYRIIRRRRWSGATCLAAALGPGIYTAAMLIDTVVQARRANRRGARASLLAAAAAAAGTAAAGIFILCADGQPVAVWMALLGVELVLAVGVFYAAAYAYLGIGRMAALMTLRCLAILALLLILFKPVFSVAGGDASRTPLPILVDRSASMSAADEAGAVDRYTEAIQMLNTQRMRLEKTLRPVWHHFAETLQTAKSLDALSELPPAGNGTDIALAIRGAVADFAPSELPGMVLVSDGLHNSAGNLIDAVVAGGVPIYVAGVGSADEAAARRRNIQLLVAETAFEAVRNNVATITARVGMTGFGSVPSELRLFEAGSDQPLATQPLWTDRSDATLTVKLKWTPRDSASEAEASGPLRKLRIVIPAHQAETVRRDNEQELHVLVSQPRIGVLYVEGSMRPEYKYLKRLLDSDPNVQFMALVRITSNRFWAQGRRGGVQLSVLPSSDDDFKLFDVLILGDLDRTFLTNDQMARIRRFVNDGGGLLMLGGHNSFGPGGYGGTDIEAALPVAVGGRSGGQETTPFIPQLTAAGAAHPVFEGLADYFLSAGRGTPSKGNVKLPELLGCVTVSGAKPAAATLAVHPERSNEAGPLVVLAVQQFGAGRAAAFTADTTWRWHLPLRGLGSEGPYQRFWGQLVRWLAGAETKQRDEKPAMALRLSRSYLQLGQQLKITAKYRQGRPKDPPAAQITCAISPAKDADGQTAQNIPLAPGQDQGMFEADFSPQKPGQYLVRATALDASGKRLAADELSLLVAPHSAEMDRLARETDTLRDIAARSGGRYADISGLPELVDHILDRRKALAYPAERARSYRLYHFPVLFIAFVVLLTGEWLLRRYWQLQ